MLSIRHIEKQYAGHKALTDVSLEVESGQIFGLLGPNGAGKTTLIRIINQIISADEGEITLFGERLEPRHIGAIGYLPEERGLYKKLKVGEQLTYFAQLKGLSRKEAVERSKAWIRKFEITDWWNKKVEDLSKGMAQKVQFISTVMHEPKLIILDEPFSGLDPVNANLIKDEIYSLAHKGATIIFSTHRMEQVEEICDHIILVNKGQKILDGTVNGIKQKFKKNHFQLWIDEETPVPADVVPEAFEIITRDAGGWLVKINEGYKPNDVLEFFIRGDYSVLSFTEQLPSLNDIFIHLVEGTSQTRQFQDL